MVRRKITYGLCNDDFIEVNSLTDELRFIECMKLYKSHQTWQALDGALTKNAKEKIRLTY